MNFLKKAAESAKGNKSSSSHSSSSGVNNGQKDDYGDKAFDFLAKKAGYKVDSNTREKITDGGRTAYEKLTGKKVDPKYSN